MTDILTPTLGESVTEATVARWAKKPGEAVKKDEVLVELETDKVSLEVVRPVRRRPAGHRRRRRRHRHPRPGAGLVSAGAAPPRPPPPGQVRAGARRSAPAAAPRRRQARAAPAPRRRRPPAAGPLGPAHRRREPAGPRRDRRHRQGRPHHQGRRPGRPGGPRRTAGRRPAPPLSGRAAPPARARGAGAHDPPAPDHRPAPEGGAEHRRHADHLQRGGHGRGDGPAHPYKDVFEKNHGVKLGFMGFFVKACVAALKEVPAVNAEIDGHDLVYKNHYDIGVAVGTDKGLVVPVVRDADALEPGRGRKGHRRPRREGPRRPAGPRGPAGRHLHHLQRRHLRLADVHPDPQPAAVGHPRHAQDPGPARWR